MTNNEILEQMVKVQDEVIQLQDEQIKNLTELVNFYRLKLERVKALISALEGEDKEDKNGRTE